MKKLILFIYIILNSLLFSDTIEVWHRWNNEESLSLLKNISKFEATTNHTVILKYFDYKVLAGKFISASNLNNAPDLIITKASLIEIFMNEGLLQPINTYLDSKSKEKFIKRTLDDAYLGDKLYGLPLTYKLLALIYNKDLIKKPPANTDDLIKIGREFTNIDDGYYGLAYPVEDFYYHIPWIHGFNGKLVGNNSVYFNSEPHKKALNFVRSLQLGEGAIMPEAVNYDLMLSLFIEGKVPMIINGTWIIADLLKANMNVGATRIPLNSQTQNYPEPYGTSELIMMSSSSKNKKVAFQLMDYLTSLEAEIESTKIGHLPTIFEVYDDETFMNGNSYDILTGFREQVEVAVSEPKDEIMRKVVWRLGASILQEMIYDTKDTTKRLNAFQEEADNIIKELNN